MTVLKELNSDRAFIFRITHIDNLSWILANGLHCQNAATKDPSFVQIGSVDLIARRKEYAVPVSPGGTLSDYVPFYFTPYSPMLYNIKTGRNGVQRRSMSEIVIFVASLHKLANSGYTFLFTDRHAYLRTAIYYSNLADLGKLNWSNWQSRDFQRNPENPEKFDCYQAEALVYRHVPIELLSGIACFDNSQKETVEQQVTECGLSLQVHTVSKWFFS